VASWQALLYIITTSLGHVDDDDDDGILEMCYES